MPGVIVEGLTKSYGDIAALKGLSFTANEGTMYGLIGPDGSGKTTFMRIAVCLLAQDTGNIIVGGHDTKYEAGSVRRQTGYMPQHFGQYADLTVGENLTFFADLFGVKRRDREERVRRLLAFSRLEPFVGRRAGQLSGGMKRKLALACTLIHTPEVLFLDEPTTGVDPVSRREFWDILAEVRRSGATIVVSTPYMDEASKCDRVGFVLDGRLIAEGTPAELPGAFTRQIIAARATDIVRRSRRLVFPSSVENVMTFGDRLHLVVRNATEAEPEIGEFLAKAGFTDVMMERVPPSLEDVFVERMSHGA